MKKIEIDIEVHRHIENARESFEESENDILRRLLGIALPEVAADSRLYYSLDYPMQHEHLKLQQNMPRPSLSEEIANLQAATLRNKLSNIPLPARDWIYKGARLPEGSLLQKWSGKQRIEGVIRHGSIVVDGVAYQSPSAAAMAVNGGVNVNGWTFWEYFDEKTQGWEKLSQLRKPYTG